MPQTAVEDRPVKVTKKQMKAEAMKRRICSAVVACLDECGYAEISINRIQERASVSRGALTHHFPTKQALVAETCMRLLHAAMRPVHAVRDDGESRPVAADDLLTGSWNDIVNTPEGRAFVEILVACRTDRDLYNVLCEDLLAWDAESAAAVSELYRGSGADEDDAALLWSICRTFLRGLLMHERFVSDPAYLNRMMDRFADIMNAHLLVRDQV
ncbi:TetR/AcrR family transcriptional regulator [Hoeflea prorocentri]|uniref:TetR/AcrR family transcriptional regulator n=1 Tax=Hoeflea prorocentri TaxID=1922333 RepID=A0A9X3UJF2_9HYPH|nr:TetR/AcrR family transcriptional regulator [Hoeflea prorocentri]MCY6382473.1 TetR/AcrR family transcriptional regulator [Hoeflea prorocentri]MDA5400273.1 TetR/AcrR family transcriptional regulator [Hoeflea prorocentri]